MKLKTVNILGCCVCRDIFRLNPDENFKVNKFIQYSNPISIVDEKQNQKRLKPEEFKLVNDIGFVQRCHCFDFNKNIISTIEENPTDYLIIDMCELRHPIGKFTTKKDSFYITETKFIPKLLEIKEKIKTLKNAEYTSYLKLSQDEIDEKLMKYVEFLKRNYAPEKIILIKTYPVHKHINTEKMCFEEIDPTSVHYIVEKLKYGNDFIEKHIPGINIIEMPENTPGYVQHTWGKDILHFVDEYYKYLYECVCVVVNNKANKKEELRKLKDYYFNYFKKLNNNYAMWFYIYKKVPESLLKNSKFEMGGGCLKDWNITLSKGSTFDKETKTLCCGNETVNWAIVSQKIDIEQLIGKEITLSIKHECISNSLFNIAIRGRIKNNGGWKYLALKRFSTLAENTETLSITIDESFKEYEFVDVAFYVNTPNHSVKILESKLEIGTKSSLF